jgi:hypothetical protein
LGIAPFLLHRSYAGSSSGANSLPICSDNCSVTRLDHLASDGHSGWRSAMVNQQLRIADVRHAAMHQPAGPEPAVEPKLA